MNTAVCIINYLCSVLNQRSFYLSKILSIYFNYIHFTSNLIELFSLIVVFILISLLYKLFVNFIKKTILVYLLNVIKKKILFNENILPWLCQHLSKQKI